MLAVKVTGRCSKPKDHRWRFLTFSLSTGYVASSAGSFVRLFGLSVLGAHWRVLTGSIVPN
jgi:hypothetical protein